VREPAGARAQSAEWEAASRHGAEPPGAMKGGMRADVHGAPPALPPFGLGWGQGAWARCAHLALPLGEPAVEDVLMLGGHLALHLALEAPGGWFVCRSTQRPDRRKLRRARYRRCSAGHFVLLSRSVANPMHVSGSHRITPGLSRRPRRCSPNPNPTVAPRSPPQTPCPRGSSVAPEQEGAQHAVQALHQLLADVLAALHRARQGVREPVLELGVAAG
jgi:hypothetical protein